MTESGIYALKNQENGKLYIGRTINLHKRKNEHFAELRGGKHHNIHLQRAWDKGQRFDFVIIEKCDPDKLNEREVFWIDKYDTFKHGYNQCAGGKSTTGRVCSEETKRKISKGNKGKKLSQETIAKRTETLKRRMEEDPEFAEAYRKGIAKGAKGKPAHNRGKKASEHTKELIRQKMLGRYISEEHKAKLRELYSGEKSLSAKLKEKDVVNIRIRHLQGERQCDIQLDYPQVTRATICDIVKGRRWKSVPMELDRLVAMA